MMMNEKLELGDKALLSGAVRRTVKVLEAFTSKDKWGVRELAAHLDIPKSGLHRILQDMAAEGLVVTNDEGAYVIGAKLLSLASGLMGSVEMARVAHGFLISARNQTSETTTLIAYDSGRQQIIAIDAVESPQEVQFSWWSLRQWTDLHLSASGKSVLAFLPPADLVRYFSKDRSRISGELVTLQSLEPELTQIRKVGWAVSHGSRIPGSNGVAAPIFDARGTVVGGIVISWPDRQTPPDDETTGRICADAAGAVSKALGWQPAPSRGSGQSV